jgi:hypothetical protein
VDNSNVIVVLYNAIKAYSIVQQTLLERTTRECQNYMLLITLDAFDMLLYLLCHILCTLHIALMQQVPIQYWVYYCDHTNLSFMEAFIARNVTFEEFQRR